MVVILQPRGDLRLELFCDADFAGHYKRDPDRRVGSTRSRTDDSIKLTVNGAVGLKNILWGLLCEVVYILEGTFDIRELPMDG
jgi:hypothetical protein